MSHNPNMTAAEGALWRQLTHAAAEAAREPAIEARAKALKKALAGADGWRMPDLRPLPAACWRAFLVMAKGYAAETDGRVRAALAPRLAALTDAAADIQTGLVLEDPRAAGWAGRADLK
jgi:hypothetical protein